MSHSIPLQALEKSAIFKMVATCLHGPSWKPECSVIALLSAYQVLKMKIQENIDLTCIGTVCYVLSFWLRGGTILSEVMSKARLIRDFKSVNLNSDGTLESSVILFKKIPRSTLERF